MAQPTIRDDFEAATRAFAFTGEWARSQTQPYAGDYCYASAPVGDGESSAASIAPAAADYDRVLSFAYRVDGDTLQFAIDAAEQFSISGAGDRWRLFAVMIPAGTAPTCTWTYSRTGAAVGADAGYIDDLVLAPLVGHVVGETYPHIAQAVPPIMYTVRALLSESPRARAFDYLAGGAGRIDGTVTVVGEPAHRYVLLLDRLTHTVIATTWSDPETGAYAFHGLDATRLYTVLAHDYTRKYNAVVADNVTPEIPEGRT